MGHGDELVLRVQRRLLEILELRRMTPGQFEVTAKREVNVDYRTTRAYLDGSRTRLQKGKLEEFESLLRVPKGTLTSTAPIGSVMGLNESSPNGEEAFRFMVDDFEIDFMNPRDFDLFATWDANSYDTVAGYSNQFFRECYEKYPQGVVGVRSSDSLIGGLEMWPITPQATRILRSNRMKDESDILPSYLACERTSDWYLGGILRSPSRSSMFTGHFILLEALEFWTETQDLQIEFPVRIWAIPVRKGIKYLAKNTGFRVEAVALAVHPVMMIEFDSKEGLRDWVQNDLSRPAILARFLWVQD